MQVQPQDALPKIMLARYYSNQLGRFLSVDPFRTSADRGNPQSWNRFTYVGNNPVGFIDPNGEYLRSVTVKPGTSTERARTLVRSGISADSSIAANSGAHLGRAHSYQQDQDRAYDIVLDDSRSPSQGATTRKTQEGGAHFGKSPYNENDSGIGGEKSVEITVPTQGLEGEQLAHSVEDALVHELTEAEIVATEGGFGNIEAHEQAEEVEQEHEDQREAEQAENQEHLPKKSQ